MVLVSMPGLQTSHRGHISYRAVRNLSSGKLLVFGTKTSFNSHGRSCEEYRNGSKQPIFPVSIFFMEVPVSMISAIWYRYRPTLDRVVCERASERVERFGLLYLLAFAGKTSCLV